MRLHSSTNMAERAAGQEAIERENVRAGAPAAARAARHDGSGGSQQSSAPGAGKRRGGGYPDPLAEAPRENKPLCRFGFGFDRAWGHQADTR